MYVLFAIKMNFDYVGCLCLENYLLLYECEFGKTLNKIASIFYCGNNRNARIVIQTCFNTFSINDLPSQ